MEIPLRVDAEVIEKAITDAVVSSAIGTRIQKSVNGCLNGYSLGNAIDDQIFATIKSLVAEQVKKNEEIQNLIIEKVKLALEKETFNKTVEEVVNRISRGY